MMDDQYQMLKRIEEEFHAIINRSFPAHFLQSSGFSGPNFHAEFSKENKFFKGTDYYYDVRNTFFHLTSPQNLFSILNSRTLRMYNLHNSNDPEEYKLSASLLHPSELEVENRKSNMYTLSFCPVDDLNNPDVWKKYGDNFKGVALVFEIANDPERWTNYHISEVKYGLSPKVSEYVNEMDKLQKKYRGFTFYLELEKLMTFHKGQQWKDEREVRILTYHPYEDFFERIKYTKPELRIEPNRNRWTEYIELHLFVDNNSACLENKREDPRLDRKQLLPSDKYFQECPQIMIKDIVFGANCGLERREYIRTKERIENLIQFNFGYRIQISPNFIS